MPIVRIEAVVPDGFAGYQAGDVQRLADALGQVLDSPPGETWVRIHTLSRSQYAENDATVPAAVQATFVDVLQYQAPTLEQRRTQATSIAAAVASALSRPKSNVHVVFLPDARDRIAFGGELED